MLSAHLNVCCLAGLIGVAVRRKIINRSVAAAEMKRFDHPEGASHSRNEGSRR
jgi:hypothetical protein